MLLIKLALCISLPLCFAKPTDVTFKNVTFKGYCMYTEKFKRTIASSNSLKDFYREHHHLTRSSSLTKIFPCYMKSLYEIRPGALKNVPMLRRLSLKAVPSVEDTNGETSLKKSKRMSSITSLSTLDLSLNDIAVIASTAFDNIPNILNINLADNKIVKWSPDWFQNTPLLTRISMQNNSVTTLPNNAFKNLKGEKRFGKIDLSINLVLSYNQIKTIKPNAFKGLTKINNLWLDNNGLEDFGEDLLEGVDVKDLRLNCNNIRCLEGDLSKIIKADTTHLDSNPFDCDCLNKIKTWAESKGKNIEIFFSEMDCTAQRIRTKMVELEKRLKEIKHQDDDIEIAEGQPASNPIK
ncbi:hypothetical protein NQ317_016438 [Molorchus minor]|uniref:Uncharacterized protein n=1 Tax=Molorchus minor TaxID=1323400 RepID=A0ABQ9JZC2_9CUCU|nr:hypothetical protein NQ317_016438 [Molorchus minor]